LQAHRNRLDFLATILGTLPYCVAIVALLLNGWHSDKTRERTWHAAIPLFAASCGVLIAWALSGQPILAMAAIILIVGACLYTHIPAFWAIPTMFLGSSAAASAIGFINMIGNLGGSLGPIVVGEKSGTSVPDALLRIVPWSAMAAAILVAANYYRTWRSRS
jgi:nitrate/nitrite transporter NarK